MTGILADGGAKNPQQGGGQNNESDHVSGKPPRRAASAMDMLPREGPQRDQLVSSSSKGVTCDLCVCACAFVLLYIYIYNIYIRAYVYDD